MERMLVAAALPLLVSLELEIPGVKYDLFPRPIPDVFCGQPLLVSGKYEGNWPDSVIVRGVLPTGTGARGLGGYVRACFPAVMMSESRGLHASGCTRCCECFVLGLRTALPVPAGATAAADALRPI
jgi:hypothetical protein